MVEPARNWRRTTDSSGVKRFDNLVKGIDVDRGNQVWQSDITYFEVRNQFYYLTFIIPKLSDSCIGCAIFFRRSHFYGFYLDESGIFW